MKFREIKEKDRKEWIKLVKDADRRDEKWAEHKFNSYLNSKKRRKMLVVEKNEKLIGFFGIKGEDLDENVSNELNFEYALVVWIALIPEYRKKGIGSKMLSICKKYAKIWSKKGIWTGCRNKVIPFYEKMDINIQEIL